MKMRGIKSLTTLLVFAVTMLFMPAAWANSPNDGHRIVINIPSRTLWLYQGEEIVKWFPVGVGRPGFSTPVGAFRVTRKILDPGWENPYKPGGASRIAPGPNNPLGTRWIGFHPYKGGEYGIHGTDRPSSVGKFSSHGCVRMKVGDAEVLFDLVDIGTPVEVRYDLVLIRKHDDKIRIATYRDVFNRGRPSVAEIRQRILEQFPGARVDDAGILAALQSPREQYMEVGYVIEDQPVMAASSDNQANGPAAADSNPFLPEPEDKPLASRYAVTQMEVQSVPVPEESENAVAPVSVPERWYVRPAWRRMAD